MYEQVQQGNLTTLVPLLSQHPQSATSTWRRWGRQCSPAEDEQQWCAVVLREWLASGARRRCSSSGAWPWTGEKKERSNSIQPKGEKEQSCDAHQMDFFARIEEDSSIRRARRRYEQEATGTRPSSSLRRTSCSARNLCRWAVERRAELRRSLGTALGLELEVGRLGGVPTLARLETCTAEGGELRPPAERSASCRGRARRLQQSREEREREQGVRTGAPRGQGKERSTTTRLFTIFSKG
jgi:hypothetical protein